MDPNGENETRVDTNLKEAEQVEITNENQEKEKDNSNELISTEIQDTHKESSVLPQSDQEPAANADDKDDINKETGKEKDSSQHSPSKHWKNSRKKKIKDEQIGDVTQWPTPDEARYSRGHPSKKPTQGDNGRNPIKTERGDRDRQNPSSRGGRRGINWKPLPEFSKSQGTGEQPSSNGTSPTASSGGVEKVGTNPVSSSGGSGRGYSGYSRGQPKRRGGRPQHAPWPRSNVGGTQQFSQEGTNAPSEGGVPVAQEIEGKDDSQLLQDSAASSQASASGQISNPPESRRYRGSVRGTSSRSSNRWRGGGGNPRGTTHFTRYNTSRGGQSFAPFRAPAPQDPEQAREQIKKQIEYYFGVDNLCRDIYLRKNMNNEGWISVHLILNFNRVRDLNVDLPRFVDALKDSTVVELKDEFVRRRDDWAGWTFPPRVEGTSPSKPQASAATETETKDQ